MQTGENLAIAYLLNSDYPGGLAGANRNRSRGSARGSSRAKSAARVTRAVTEGTARILEASATLAAARRGNAPPQAQPIQADVALMPQEALVPTGQAPAAVPWRVIAIGGSVGLLVVGGLVWLATSRGRPGPGRA